jgi:hypothetical protein
VRNILDILEWVNGVGYVRQCPRSLDITTAGLMSHPSNNIVSHCEKE